MTLNHEPLPVVRLDNWLVDGLPSDSIAAFGLGGSSNSDPIAAFGLGGDSYIRSREPRSNASDGDTVETLANFKSDNSQIDYFSQEVQTENLKKFNLFAETFWKHNLVEKKNHHQISH